MIKDATASFSKEEMSAALEVNQPVASSPWPSK
jgi:hypothetical protein